MWKAGFRVLTHSHMSSSKQQWCTLHCDELMNHHPCFWEHHLHMWNVSLLPSWHILAGKRNRPPKMGPYPNLVIQKTEAVKSAATCGIWMARTHNDFPAIRQESAISYRSWRAKTFEDVFVRLGCVKRGVPEVGNALYLASWLLVSMISWDLYTVYIYIYILYLLHI